MRNGPYELVLAPQGYPGMRYRGLYCYEHHLVYWKTSGTLPEPGQIIHHVDGNKRNNHPSNLELMDAGEHGSHHAVRADPVIVPCGQCGKGVPVPPRNYRFKTKHGQKHFFCNRSCMAKRFGRGRPIR